MKKKIFNKILVLLLIFPLHLFAQDITGVWTGQLFVDSTKRYIPYEISISENKGQLVGYSHISFIDRGKDVMGLMTLKISRDGNEIEIQDGDFITNTFNRAPPKSVKKTMMLTLTIADTIMTMKGGWSTNKTNRYLAATGTVEIQHTNDFKPTVIYKKLDELKLTDSLSYTQVPKKQEPVIAAVQEPVITKADEVSIMPFDKKEIQPAVITQAAMLTKSNRAVPKIILRPVKVDSSNLTAVVKKPIVKQTPPPVIAVKQKPVIKQVVAAAPPVAKPPVIVAKPATEKPKEVVVAPPVPRPQTQYVPPAEAKLAAVEVAGRKTNVIQSVYFESDSLVLTLYDNGVIDGDTVSVLMNGRIIIARQMLTTDYNSKVIYIDPGTDSIMLVLYAESLGTIPPNTGVMVVHDGNKAYDVGFSTDFQTNAGIILKRRKDGE